MGADFQPRDKAIILAICFLFRRLLCIPSLSEEKRHSLSRGLASLERLPLCSRGIRLALDFRSSLDINENDQLMICWTIVINEDEVEASINGSYSVDGWGPDSFTGVEFLLSRQRGSSYDDYRSEHRELVGSLPCFCDSDVQELNLPLVAATLEIKDDSEVESGVDEIVEDQTQFETRFREDVAASQIETEWNINTECTELSANGWVDDSRLIGLDPKAYPNLESIDLSNTGITDQGVKFLLQFSKLRSINLSLTGITTSAVTQLLPIYYLTKLSLAYTGIEDEACEVLAQMTNLTHLDLSYTSLSGKGIEKLSVLRQLSTLKLAHCDICDTEIGQIANFKEITYLDLSYNPISNDGLRSLSAMKQLAYVNLEECMCSAEGIQRLKDALPENCEVRWAPPPLLMEKCSSDVWKKYSSSIEQKIPLHSNATCLSAERGKVLIGFNDGTIARWSYHKNEYHLRPVHQGVPLGLCFGREHFAYSVFNDTTVLMLDLESGDVADSFNCNALEEDQHKKAVAEAVERMDEYGNPRALVDDAIMGSYPTQSSIHKVFGQTSGSLLYSLRSPGIDSWGSWVVDFYCLYLWGGKGDALQPLVSTSDDEFMGIVYENRSHCLVIATEAYLIRYDLVSQTESELKQDQKIVNVFNTMNAEFVLVVSISDIYLVSSYSLVRTESLFSSLDGYICSAVMSGDSSLLLFQNAKNQWRILTLVDRIVRPLDFPHKVEKIVAVPSSVDQFVAIFENDTANILRVHISEEEGVPF
jgi:hypothetical protein